MKIKINHVEHDLLKIAGFVRADGIVSVTGAQLLAADGRDGTYQVWKDGPVGDETLVRNEHFIGAKDGDEFYTVPPVTMPRYHLPVEPCLCHGAGQSDTETP